MNGSKGGWTNEWMDEWMDEWMNDWCSWFCTTRLYWVGDNLGMNGWTIGWMDEWMDEMNVDGWMNNEWMDECLDEYLSLLNAYHNNYIPSLMSDIARNYLLITTSSRSSQHPH